VRAHSGSPADGGAWAGRLLVIELSGDDMPLSGLEFPDPVLDDGPIASRFLAMHHDSEAAASALEREGSVLDLLASIAARSPQASHPAGRAVRGDAAVRLAIEHLREDTPKNVTLDELAMLAGLSKYELVRRFRAATGIPPHAYQVALRVSLARRLLERGERPADAAALAGFTDQSHLNRHFTRRVGLTPAQYARSSARP
jgi:AraC-like DNA-binding protein